MAEMFSKWMKDINVKFKYITNPRQDELEKAKFLHIIVKDNKHSSQRKTTRQLHVNNIHYRLSSH